MLVRMRGWIFPYTGVHLYPVGIAECFLEGELCAGRIGL